MAILIICVGIALLFILPKVMMLPCGNMTLITGGIKTGKTTLSVHLAIRTYRRNLFRVRLYNLFHPKHKRELPLLYSNIPLKVQGYTPLTLDLCARRERFRFRSVAYVCESSLLADSQSYKDQDINDSLLLLNKLFAHETHGGSIFYDTQSISDNHYAVKRCLSTYYHIHHTVKWIPFFLIMRVRECFFSEDGPASSITSGDAGDDLKLVIIPKSVWKRFDCYCYSVLTDDLPIRDDLGTYGDGKARHIISFKYGGKFN